MAGKIIIISAPSGSGKSTIIGAILQDKELDLQFSVSATSRPPRKGEKEGIDYFFLSEEQFRQALEEEAFVEWEEVYPGRFYGTLRREVERICAAGHNAILDIDVKGGKNVKEQFGERALSIFIMPPSVEELRRRLEKRGTDSAEVIDQRVGKARYEIGFAGDFDCRVVNDDLQEAVGRVRKLIQDFINK